MITEDEITKIFCMADDFCKIYDKFIMINGLGPKRDRRKREYHRASKMSDSEVITIIILFHFSGYKCLKHFYIRYVLVHMRHLFPTPVSYNRFTELERKVIVPFILILKKCLMGGCTGISYFSSNSRYNNASWTGDYNTHDNCIRLVDSKLSNSNYTGHPLGTIEAGETAEYAFVMTLDQGWVVDNLHLVIFVTTPEGKAWLVNNAVACPVNGSVEYQYE